MNLDNLKKQATLLVRWHREGNYSIGGRIRSLPRYRNLTDVEALAQGRIQLVIAEHLPGQPERAIVEVTAGSDPEMLPEVAADRLGRLPCKRGQRVVDALQVERDALTEMTEDHLQPGQPVEYAAEDYPQRVQRRLVVPAVAGGGQCPG